MNERIKELVRNAGLTIEHDVVFGSHSYEGKLGMHGDEIEKFAELIVQECILTIQKGITRDGNTTEKYLRSMEHIKHIRGHFGLCSLCGGKMFPGVAINPKLGTNARYIAPQSPLTHRNLEIINVLKCSVCGASETNEDFKNEQQ